MKLLDIILISFALALDAFTVSICKGITLKKNKIKKSFIISSYFGFFQSLMTLLGYLFGNIFYNLIINFDHWIAFILLLIIGINMIIESFNNDNIDDDISFKKMFFLSIATSIDALVIGITLSLFNLNILFIILIIGLITFILCYIGSIFGVKIKKYLNFNTEIIGGIILILLGFKILFEHLNILLILI